MNDKELIRRALMGEKRAQEECTQKRIALPCPFCGKEDSVETLDCYTAEGLKCESERFRKDCFKCVCNYLKGGCGTSTGVSETKQEALEKWNTRPALPVIHAKWEWYGPCRDNKGTYWATCTACGIRQRLGDYENYCPKCGARMDLEGDEQ